MFSKKPQSLHSVIAEVIVSVHKINYCKNDVVLTISSERRVGEINHEIINLKN